VHFLSFVLNGQNHNTILSMTADPAITQKVPAERRGYHARLAGLSSYGHAAARRLTAVHRQLNSAAEQYPG
jgi:hypothetical protein